MACLRLGECSVLEKTVAGLGGLITQETEKQPPQNVGTEPFDKKAGRREETMEACLRGQPAQRLLKGVRRGDAQLVEQPARYLSQEETRELFEKDANAPPGWGGSVRKGKTRECEEGGSHEKRGSKSDGTKNTQDQTRMAQYSGQQPGTKAGGGKGGGRSGAKTESVMDARGLERLPRSGVSHGGGELRELKVTWAGSLKVTTSD